MNDMKKYIVCIFLLCVAVVSSCGGFRTDRSGHNQEKAGNVLRIVAYNVGVFSKCYDSMQDIAKMMQEMGADAMVLCELDSCNRRHGSFQLEDFARVLGCRWQYCFGSAMSWNGGSYGIGAATVHCIEDSFEIKIPKGTGHEPRVCVAAETAEYVIAAVHLDHKNEEVRMEQARIVTEKLKERYSRSRKPVFLCGDFNAVPDSPTLRQLSEDWDLLSETAPTYPADNPRKCIDYIMALKNRAGYEVLKTAVSTEFESADVRQTSDHLPVYVDVRIR